MDQLVSSSKEPLENRKAEPFGLLAQFVDRTHTRGTAMLTRAFHDSIEGLLSEEIVTLEELLRKTDSTWIVIVEKHSGLEGGERLD